MIVQYDLVLKEQAKQNMRNIFYYIYYVLKASGAAKETAKNIRMAIKGLCSFPGRYPLVEYEPWKSRGFRRMVVKNYLVYFWIDDDSQKVYIFAVVYAKSNQIEKLNGLK